MTRKEKKSLKQQLKQLSGVRGEMRRSHFESGGDMASWRGTHTVIPDKKKKKDKNACRGKWE